MTALRLSVDQGNGAVDAAADDISVEWTDCGTMAAMGEDANVGRAGCDWEGDSSGCGVSVAAEWEWLSGTAPGGMCCIEPKKGERVEEAAMGDMNNIVEEAGGASGTTGTESGVG